MKKEIMKRKDERIENEERKGEQKNMETGAVKERKAEKKRN
jgi:hypothetical protein